MSTSTAEALPLSPHPSTSIYRPSWKLLALLMVVGLLPRVAGVLWGYQHPDENINASVKLMAGQIIPDAHYYPPLSNFLNAFAFAAMFVIGWLVGVWHSLGDFRAQYFSDPTPFLMTGRFVCATLGALAAPLTAMLASRFGARRWGSILAALLVALIPINVLLSHISKSTDVGMATAFILVAICFFDFMADPSNWRRAVGLGIAIALAVSFKHSAVFFVAPVFFAALGCSLYRGTLNLRSALRAGAIIGCVAAALWVVLNVPILLDFNNFLRFQKVQSQMSSRPGNVTDILGASIPMIVSTFTGTTILVAIVFLMLPIVRRETTLVLLWASIIVGSLVVMKVTGVRPTVGLYLPYVTLMVALVGAVLGRWISSEQTPQRMGGAAIGIACGLFLAFGCARVVSQALAEPAVDDVGRIIQKTMPADVKILATRPEQAGLPISAEAFAGERARHERLAVKYNVKLPKQAEERIEGAAGGYHVRRVPWVVGGLEVYDEKDVKNIAPFGWPLQKEEYELSYWTSQGFTVFVLTDEQNRRDSKVPAYVALYDQIRASCDLVKEVKARKPMFWEGNTRIYRLKGSPSAQTQPATQPR